MKLTLILNVIFASGLVLAQSRTRGQSCFIQRKDGVITSQARCERGLICAGFGPHEILNNGGGAHHTDFDLYRGVCINLGDIETV
ncbi:hypothetical protein BD770DRAFT_384212 [Pilaira anomala]|nr:hypothetical protein BD770DRAFT_384212 [Pilaira anomala]